MNMDIRRIVTGHDQNGRAVVTHDGEPPLNFTGVTGNGNALIWVTDRAPADNNDGADAGSRKVGIAPEPGGSIIRVVEYPPESERGAGGPDERAHLASLGARLPQDQSRHPGMHKTDTVDYAIIMAGEIHMLLDCSEVHLKAGDVEVQRGTFHAWSNRGSQPCRIAFILIDADPAP